MREEPFDPPPFPRDRARNNRRVLGVSRCLCLFLGLLVSFNVLWAEDETNKEETAEREASVSQIEPETSKEPSVDPQDLATLPFEELPFRMVGFFQSQLAELVPQHFTPIKKDRFLEAARKWNDSLKKRAPYRITSIDLSARMDGDTLVSDRSEIRVQLFRPGSVSCELSPCNLLVKPVGPKSIDPNLPDPTKDSTLPVFVTTPAGDLAAIVEAKIAAEVSLPFQWKLYGKPTSSGHVFDLRIPRSPLASLSIEVPEDIELESMDGIPLQRRSLTPSVPEDESSDEESLDSAPLSVYQFEVAGLSRIRFRSVHRPTANHVESLVVRRCRMEYNLESDGISWIHRMVVNVPATENWPELEIANSQITSIKINAAEASFETKVVSQSVFRGSAIKVRRTRWTPPPGAINRQDSIVNVTIMGRTDWQTTTVLPIPYWIGTKVINASVQADVLLAITQPMSLIAWELPSAWQENSVSRREGIELHQAVGPLQSASDPSHLLSSENEVPSSENVLFADKKEVSDSETTIDDSQEGLAYGHPSLWSQIQVAENATYQACDLWLKLEATETILKAKAILDLSVHSRQVEPVRLHIQEGWDLERLSFANSGRSIDLVSLLRAAGGKQDGTKRSLIIWPSVSDLRLIKEEAPVHQEAPEKIDQADVPDPAEENQDDGSSEDSASKRWSLPIEITASRSIESKREVITLPSTWLARVDTDDDTLTVSITPPEGMKWSNRSGFSLATIKPSDLSTEQQRFFEETGRSTRMFRPRDGVIGPIQMDPPDIAFSADLRFDLARESADWIETIRVQLRSTQPNLGELRILIGPNSDRGEYQWSIAKEGGAMSHTISTADISHEALESEGMDVLNVSRVDLRNATLIGSRRFTGRKFTTTLPHVMGANSVNSEAFLSPRIKVVRKDSSIQAVPLSSLNRDPSTDSETLVSQHFRYDSRERPSFTLEPLETDPRVNVIVLANYRIVASTRGSDRIEGIFQTTIVKPLTIQYEPSLQLVSVTRGATEMDISTLPQHPIVIAPMGSSTQDYAQETIRVVWQRNQFQSSMTRKVRIPRIETDAIVMQQQYRLMASPDSFLPRALLEATTRKAANAAIPSRLFGSGALVTPEETYRLVRRNTILGLGWLISISVFSLGWFVMRRSPLLVAATVVLLMTVAIQWWQWRLPISGWFIAPLVIAGMLVTARAWNAKINSSALQNSRFAKASSAAQRTTDSVHDEQDPPDDPSLSFFSNSILRVVLWVVSCAILLAADGRVACADDDSRVNILVPLDSAGNQVGDVIYVPKELRSQLFQTEAKREPQKPLIRSAQYRMKIANSTPTGFDLRETLIEVDLELMLPEGVPTFNEVLLPIAAQNVRRMEWIGENNRIVRFSSHLDGNLRATLPRGSEGRLRLTMVPRYESDKGWHRFSMPIPIVFDSSLSVESDGDIRVLRLGGAEGRLMTETDLRRWVQPVGPTNQLQIDFRLDPNSADASNPPPTKLQRRYWISAGEQQVTIDCEVEPSNSIAAGELFKFVIRDKSLPTLTSRNWRLVKSDLFSPNRRLMTVQSIRDTPGPVRLLWTQPIRQSRGTGSVWFKTINPPEVIASSLGENAPAWIAFHAAEPFQWAPVLESSEPLAVDSFLAAWSGYQGPLQRSLVAIDRMPSLVLRKVPHTPSIVDAHHKLHVTQGKWELTYEASLRPTTESPCRFSLELPANANILDLRLNGRKILSAGIRIGNRRLVRLGDFQRDEVISVSLRATRNLLSTRSTSSDHPFEPPVISIVPASGTWSAKSGEQDEPGILQTTLEYRLIRNDVYSVTRDPSCQVIIKEPFRVPMVRSRTPLEPEQLMIGHLPVATWTMRGGPPSSGRGVVMGPVDNSKKEHSMRNDWGGSFLVQSSNHRFNSEQVISLKREDGRWLFSFDLKITGSGAPEYIDIEIPDRWSDELTVLPQTIWGTIESQIHSATIIRLRCEGERFKEIPIRVQGKLQTREDGKISVPRIRVLGEGQHSVFARTPNRLVNEKIQWRETGTGGRPIPDWFQHSRDDSISYSTHHIVDPSWSIDLAPLPKTDFSAIASAQDNQVFLRENSVIVLSHWDLAPGNRNALVLDLPSEAKTLAAWCLGQAVEIESIENVSLDDKLRSNTQRIRLPLILSRLPQTVQLMMELPVDATKSSRSYLPHPVDIPITESWLATYLQRNSTAVPLVQGRQQADREEQRSRRLLRLAASAVESVESAVDLLVDRPSDEVAGWLARWIQRYQALARQDQHVVDFSIDSPVEMEMHELATEPSMQKQWKLLDARMGVYVARYRGDQSGPTTSLSPMIPFTSFVPVTVESLGSLESPPTLRLPSESDHWARPLITRSMTVLLVLFVCLAARSTQRWLLPLVVHPAVWMGTLALIGFIIAPPLVAAALLFVAVCLPAFPSSTRGWMGAWSHR